MIDIRDYPEAIETINAVISNGGACEVKTERRKDSEMLVVVELSRQVKKTTPVK